MYQVLLLTNSYEFNSFIEERRAIKLMCNGKVEAVSYWDDYFIYWGNGKNKFPSILKLINPIKRFNKNIYNFSRKGIIKRDKSTCQYCSRTLSGNEITIDHVVPRSHGGKSSFTNCVVSCIKCNSVKSNKTLEESGIKLIKKPQVPDFIIFNQPDNKFWHKDWTNYIGHLINS